MFTFFIDTDKNQKNIRESSALGGEKTDHSRETERKRKSDGDFSLHMSGNAHMYFLEGA